jgi:uncharacterized protein YoxC
MEISQIILNHGLTFLAISTGITIVIVGGFLIKLAVDLSKLTKNVDETTSIIKSEIGPTITEFNNALKSINSIAQNADKKVDSLSKVFESLLGVSSTAFVKAKDLSGGIVKGFVKGLVSVIKMFLKK